MLKYADYDIVFQEIPDEVTLAINISNCPCHCVGCHSPQLADDIGEPLTEEVIDELLKKYGSAVTCVAFMGGDIDPSEVEQLARYVKQRGKKSGWYSGRDELPATLNLSAFDYVKVGSYQADKGALKEPTTNQRLYRNINNTLHDITSRFWRTLLLLLPFFFSIDLIAQNNDSVIVKDFGLDEIEVVTSLKENIIAPQRLEGEKLQALSTYSIADAVRYFSGIQVKDYGGVGGLKTVDIRSMGTHHLGVFYDGIEIGNAQNGTVDLGKFSTDNIEEISLYNGQKSDIFQPAKDYGSSGTLYIKTRRPHFKKDKSYNVEVTMKAGTFGLANPSILYEQRITDNIHLSANAEYTYATGRYHFRYHKVIADAAGNTITAWDTVGIRQNGDIQAIRAELGMFGYLPEGKWHVKGYFYNSERGIPRAIVRNVWTSEQRQWDRNAFVQGNFTKTIVKNYDLQFNAKYSNDYMHYLNPDTTLMYINNQFWQQEIYLSLANKYSLSGLIKDHVDADLRTFGWDINLSADYLYNWLRADLVNFVFPRRHTALVAFATNLRWKWFKLQASGLYTSVTDKITQPTKEISSPAKQKNIVTPAMFFSYQPYLPEALYIHAFYKKIFRMPTFNDLYYTDVGNTSLRPEYTTQYDIGVQYEKKWDAGVFRAINVKADGYFNQVIDKIVAIPKGNSQYRWMMMNLGYVEILGAETNASTTLWIPGDLFFTLGLSYTYQRAKDLSDPSSRDPYGGTYGGQIAYIPRHSGSVTANLHWRMLDLNYSFIYVGERYHNSANTRENYEPSWYTHDIALSALWQFEKFGLKTSVEVNNFCNQQYDVILNYPMPGINGKVILKFLF